MTKLNAVAQIMAGAKELDTLAKKAMKLERAVERKDAVIEKLRAKLQEQKEKAKVSRVRKPRQAKVEEEIVVERKPRRTKVEQVEEVKKPRRTRKVKAEEVVEEAPKARRQRKVKVEQAPSEKVLRVVRKKSPAKAKM